MKKNEVINQLCLQEIEGLTSDDGADLVISLSEKFLALLPKRIQALRSAVLSKNFDRVCRETHSLKTSCEIVGAEQLTSHIVRLDLAARNGETSVMLKHLAEVERTAELTKKELITVVEKRRTHLGATG